jgi:hypothetical protein
MLFHSRSTTRRIGPYVVCGALAMVAGCAGGASQVAPATNSRPSGSQQSAFSAPLGVVPQNTTLAQRAQAQVVKLAASAYQKAVKKTNPVAYFPLNSPKEGSVGKQYTVALDNGAQIANGGAIPGDKKNKFLSLSGTAYATTSLSGNVPGTGSIVAWVNLSELPSTAGNYFYVAGESQYANDLDLQFETDNVLYFYAGGQPTTYGPNPSTLIGQWNMIAVTYQATGATQFQNMYWNGALVTATGGSGNGNPKTSQFSIGESLVFTGRYFQGGIDAVGLWDRALTTQEVANIYQAAQ